MRDTESIGKFHGSDFGPIQLYDSHLTENCTKLKRKIGFHTRSRLDLNLLLEVLSLLPGCLIAFVLVFSIQKWQRKTPEAARIHRCAHLLSLLMIIFRVAVDVVDGRTPRPMDSSVKRRGLSSIFSCKLITLAVDHHDLGRLCLICNGGVLFEMTGKLLVWDKGYTRDSAWTGRGV